MSFPENLAQMAMLSVYASHNMFHLKRVTMLHYWTWLSMVQFKSPFDEFNMHLCFLNYIVTLGLEIFSEAKV